MIGTMGLAAAVAAAQPLPQVGAGTIERLENFPSRHVDARHVDVWLPPGYSTDKRYEVLYMHDGQMLFDPKTTWNRQAWQVDAVAGPLQAAGKLRDFIVVGPWNNGDKRRAEYFPQKALPHLVPDALRDDFVRRALLGKPLADAYLRFLVEELKPAIDRRYATRPEADGTFLMGSSYGGLISIYGLLEYPQVFGGAAALSTHWIGGFERNAAVPDAMLAYLRATLPQPGRHRLYMARGTTQLDALYDEAQPRVDMLLRERGYAAPDFVTVVHEGDGHNEADWHKRLAAPLQFLLGR
jgi:enterochelin esterase-like enzyme